MKRLLSSLALGAAVVLGATGCGMVAPQATTIMYSAADGVNVPAPDAPLQVRNALIVADESGENGNFVAAIVNDTSESHTLSLEFGEGGTAIAKTVRVPAGTVLSLGAEGNEPLLVEGIDTPPGADIPVAFQSGDSDTVRIDVPVLDGTLPYLAPLVP